MKHVEVAVVGAGIVGLATARELLRRGVRSLCVVDKESRIGAHQTSHNSGVIHAGVYYAPGSMRASLCVRGAQQMFEYCAEHKLPHSRVGKLIAAVHARELPRLDALFERGTANGVPGLVRVTGEEAREIQPGVRALAALWSPNTGIADFHAVAQHMAREVRARGGDVHTNTAVHALHEESSSSGSGGGAIRVHDGLVADRVLVCAGLHSDRAAATRSEEEDDTRSAVVPFRGDFYRLVPTSGAARAVKTLIYPVPDPRLPFLGVHVTPTQHGDVLLGPTAWLSLGREAYGEWWRGSARDVRALWQVRGRLARFFRAHWQPVVHNALVSCVQPLFVREVQQYIDVRPEDVEYSHAGIRAQLMSDEGKLVEDFALTRAMGGRVVRVLNAPSPAATASLAIAEHVADALYNA